MSVIKIYWDKLKENKIVLICSGVLLLAFLVLMLVPSGPAVYQKTQQQIGTLASAIRTYYAKQPHYWGLNNETALKNDIVPPMMVKKGKIVSALGKPLILGASLEGTPVLPGAREFAISLDGLSKSVCMKLLSAPMPENLSLGLLKISVLQDGNATDFEWGQEENALPISFESAKHICKNNNAISFIFE